MNSVKLQVLPGGRAEGQARQESFVQVFSSLVRCKELSNTAFRLYCLLLDYSWGGKQECNPSQETLAFEMGVKEITIRRAVAELEGFDLITVKSSKNAGCNTYKLNRVVSNVEKLPIINDPSDRSDQINFDGSRRSKLIYKTHGINHTGETYTQEVAVCKLSPFEDKESDPWNQIPLGRAVEQQEPPPPVPATPSPIVGEASRVNIVTDKPVVKDENMTASSAALEKAVIPPATPTPAPDERLVEFGELLKVAGVLPKKVPELVAGAISAGRDGDFIRRLIVASLDKHNPGAWLVWALHNNFEPPQPGLGIGSGGAASVGRVGVGAELSLRANAGAGIYAFRGAEAMRRAQAKAGLLPRFMVSNMDDNRSVAEDAGDSTGVDGLGGEAGASCFDAEAEIETAPKEGSGCG
jgi:hypothetical protein